ncbi:hypothetical protein [Paucisalibacillus sp. EB02]|uniref:hypothetical protein n=1 Tax=Paucisalibacillus sp. EB02 TaxID=1347087 RepID=UPI0004B6CB77|nr:hypothetical protein [Paucisalibacillus sp. EB02]
MTLRTKTMTVAEVKGLRDSHRLIWENLEKKLKANEIRTRLDAIASVASIWIKFIGPYGTIAAITDLLLTFHRIDEIQTAISHFRGAEQQFKLVYDRLVYSGYRAAQVQMVWVKYPLVSTTGEFVEGNNVNPALGYKIVKLQKSDGNWINPPIGS